MCLLTVKQVGTDATYTGIVIAGIAVTGIVHWMFDCHIIGTILAFSFNAVDCHMVEMIIWQQMCFRRIAYVSFLILYDVP